MNRRFLRALIVLLLIALAAPFAAHGAENADVRRIPVRFYNVDGIVHEFDAEYSDEIFSCAPETYSHALARASLCCAVAAFRLKTAPLEEQDQSIRAYLSGAGFEDIESDSYHTAPTGETISNALAHKTLPDGRTLVALAVCGGCYGNEWLSNLNVGDETRHTGFNAASLQIQARLGDYLARHGIEDGAALWLTGFSRGAAVANITAADMTDSGRFSAVYAYTFATPRTTRERGQYDNIFNIMGSEDVVPRIPFAEWGYGRFGRDRFIASQENYSAYPAFRAQADPLSQAITGRAWRNNPAINAALRQVLCYLYAILGNSAEYQTYLYPELCALWNGFGTDHMIELLSAAVKKMDGLSEEKAARVEELTTYLSRILYETTADGNVEQLSRGYWDSDTTIPDNVMHEHTPATYLSAVLSSADGELLFAEEPGYTRFVLGGEDFAIDIYDINGFICAIDKNGKVSQAPFGSGDGERYTEARPEFYIEHLGTQVIVDLPLDELYIISLSCKKAGEVAYLGTTYTPDDMTGHTSRIYKLNMEPGNDYYILSGRFEEDELADGSTLLGDADYSSECWDSRLPYSPVMLLDLESSNHFQMDVQMLVGIVVMVLMVVVFLLLVCLLLALVRLIRHKKRVAGMAIAFHALVLLLIFLLEEGARYYMRGFPIVMSVLKGLASLDIALLAVKGVRRCGRAADGFICAGLLLYGVGDVLMNRNMPLALGLDCAGNALLALGFARERRPRPWQIVLGAAFFAASAAVIFYLRRYSPVSTVFFVIYAVAFAAMLAFSLRCRPLTAAAVFIIAAADVLMGVNFVLGETAMRHMISLGGYYVGALTLAASVWIGKGAGGRRGKGKGEDGVI